MSIYHERPVLSPSLSVKKVNSNVNIPRASRIMRQVPPNTPLLSTSKYRYASVIQFCVRAVMHVVSVPPVVKRCKGQSV
jgi:hypothetical protein